MIAIHAESVEWLNKLVDYPFSVLTMRIIGALFADESVE